MRHKSEDLEWLLKTVTDYQEAGADNLSEALRLTQEDWCARIGHKVSLDGMRQVLLTAKAMLLQRGMAAPEEIGAACYLLYVPANPSLGIKEEFRFLPSCTEAQEAFQQVIARNNGFVPAGLKLFGEIVVEARISLSFKNRGMQLPGGLPVPGGNGKE